MIDVREPDEYQQAHVPGATLIPLATVPDRLSDVPAERRRARDLQERRPQHAGRRVPGRQRHRRATNVAGGTMAWIDSGRPSPGGRARVTGCPELTRLTGPRR